MIDSHQHFWQYDPVTFEWIDDSMATIRKSFYPSDLAPILKANNVDGTVLVQVNQDETENEAFLAHAAQNEFILGTVAWVDFMSKNLKDRLDYYTQKPILKGFRHIVQAEADGFLLQKEFLNGIGKLASYGYTYDILVKEHQLKDVLQFVRQFPNQKFVIDHIAKPDIKNHSINKWSNYISQIAQHENVFIKVSGMVTEADYHSWKPEDIYPYLEHVLRTFGPSRIMYGSDWPVCLVAAAYEEQLAVVKSYFSKLSSTEQHAIFDQTARSFYSL